MQLNNPGIAIFEKATGTWVAMLPETGLFGEGPNLITAVAALLVALQNHEHAYPEHLAWLRNGLAGVTANDVNFVKALHGIAQMGTNAPPPGLRVIPGGKN